MYVTPVAYRFMADIKCIGLWFMADITCIGYGVWPILHV